MMLVVVTVLCVLLAWKLRKVERQKVAVAAVRQAGGSAYYDGEVGGRAQPPRRTKFQTLLGDDFFDEVVKVDFSIGIVPIEESDHVPFHTVPKQLAFLTSLQELNLAGRDIKDLNLLSSMTELTCLHVSSGDIVDLSPLKACVSMETLWVHDSRVKDLSPLGGMHRLKDLSLGTVVEDISPLGDLTTLEYLWLTNTTTRDVTPLTKLKKLKRLVIYAPGAPDTQIQILRDALPNCEIVYGWFTDA